MTKKILIFILVIFILICIFFYFRPLPAKYVFRDLENVGKVTFVVKFDLGRKEDLQIDLIGREVELFTSLLNLTKYKRSIGETNIRKQNNVYDILLVFGNNDNFSIDINDKGRLVVYNRDGANKYIILSSKEEALFKLIDEIVKDKLNTVS